MSLGRARISRDREDSKGKKNQNDEGEHNEQGKYESRRRRRLPRRKSRLPVLRHGRRRARSGISEESTGSFLRLEVQILR